VLLDLHLKVDDLENVVANQLKTDMGLETADPFTPDDGEVDPRLDHTIGRRGIPYLDWQDFPGKAWIRNQPNAGPYQTKKYAYYESDKGSLQDNSTWTPGYTAINYTIIRFADILLMAAEAEYEVGSPEKAREYVNHVRARAADPAGWVMKGGSPAADYVIALKIQSRPPYRGFPGGIGRMSNCPKVSRIFAPAMLIPFAAHTTRYSVKQPNPFQAWAMRTARTP
jgi:hypothetical protein